MNLSIEREIGGKYKDSAKSFYYFTAALTKYGKISF